MLESIKQGKPSVEGLPTQSAQRVGFDLGRTFYSIQNPFKSMLHPVNPFPPR
jgi:hypothetical protein